MHRMMAGFGGALLAVAAACGAEDWISCGWGGGGFYFCAAYDPVQDGVLYMGGDVNGVYKSVDRGRTWKMMNCGLANYGVYSLAVDRTHPQTVYAATQDGLCKSVDGAAHWELLPQTGPKELRLTGERKKSIRAVAVDPTDGNIVYAASPGGRVCKSTDGGRTWAVAYAKQGAPEAVESVPVQYGKVNQEWCGGLWTPVAFPKEASSAACTGIGVAFKGGGAPPRDCFLTIQVAGGGRYRSRNLRDLFADTQWRDIVLKTGDFSVDPDDLAKNPARAKALPASPDWAAVQRLDFACVGPLMDAAAPCRLARFFFAFGEPKAAQTICDVAQLKKAAVYGNARIGELGGGVVYGVAVAAAKPARVLAATEDAGVVISEDAGRTWRETTTPRKVAGAAVADSDPNVIYAACFKDGVWKSVDGGRTWAAVSEGLDKACSIIEVAVSPANPLDVYAIGAQDWSGRIYVSHDGGRMWKESSELAVDREGSPTVLQGGDSAKTRISAPTNLAINPRNPQELFISANWRPCMSEDGGLTWTERDRGADISCVYDIRFHGGRVYAAAMDEGAFVSADNGGRWRQVAPLKSDPSIAGHCWRVAISDRQGVDRILATFSPWWDKYAGRVVISEDGGRSCEIVTAGLPDYIPRANTMWGVGHARALAVDPRDPMTVYLGMDGDPSGGKAGGGIFKSVEGGRTWAQLPNQPGSRRVFFGLAVDPTDSKRLYWGACGTGGGLYRSDDGGGSWTHVFRNESWVFNVVVAPDGTVYCPGRNLWRSADRGATWKQLTHRTDDGIIVGLECDPANPKRIWHSVNYWNDHAQGGVFRTDDDGATWQEITGNLPYVKPLILRYNPAAGELWAGGVGLYRIKQ